MNCKAYIHDGKLGRDDHNWFESSGLCALCLENQVLTHMGLLTERNSNNYQLNILVGQEQHFSDLTTWLITAHNTDNYIYTRALGQSGDKNRTWASVKHCWPKICKMNSKWPSCRLSLGGNHWTINLQSQQSACEDLCRYSHNISFGDLTWRLNIL